MGFADKLPRNYSSPHVTNFNGICILGIYNEGFTTS